MKALLIIGIVIIFIFVSFVVMSVLFNVGEIDIKDEANEDIESEILNELCKRNN